MAYTKKCLRTVYSDKTLPSKDLLEKDASVTVRIRNLQVLATKMFGVYKDLLTAIVTVIFHMR